MPQLTDFAPSVIFGENTVNATPQLLDTDVAFTDVEGDFNGGSLTLSGLLAEDTVSVRNEGSGAGQIGLSGANVTYGGVVIGTLAGGAGATLTITFNSAATSVAIDALIQNLTYANSSDTPTANRDLTLNVTDAAGNELAGDPALALRTGAANPFDGVDVGYWSKLTFADLDADGDLDAVVGESDGTLNYFENTGTASAPVFTPRTGTANPFNGVDVGSNSTPTFADLDNDGDLDALVGENFGQLLYYENTGTASAPVFTPRTGTANPFNGVNVGGGSAPVFADLDGDGDLDALIGEKDGVLNYYENTGTALAPVFTVRTGTANPFNGADVGAYSNPVFADFDGDGDLDAVVGGQAGFGLYTGFLVYYENTGTASAPVFTERTGTANPFNGVDVGIFSIAPALADLDDDGDPDAVVGEYDGVLNYIENTTVPAPSITVTVNAGNDVPTAIGLPTDVTVTEDVASDLDLSAVSLADVDTTGSITVVLTASAGTMTATSGGGVTVSNSGTGAITLAGTVSDIDAFLNTASAVQYTGASNANGDNAATLTVTADDGSGAVELGVVNIDITPVIDPPVLTGFAPSVTFGENTVNSTPQLLDVDVAFTDSDGDYDGGALTVSGLLAEDMVSVRNEGAGAGQIGLSGADVTFGGVVIGTLAGGAGATLTITFNAAATPAAIDALIQNLTYANSSDTPTESRDLTLNITDAAGNDLWGDPAFTQSAGAANPFDGVDVGYWSKPTFVDLDGDGDLDAVVGEFDGTLNYFENTGTASAPVFTPRTGTANPFNGVDVGSNSTPTFADLDNDGDLDALVGEYYGPLLYYENTGTASAPVFTPRTGTANPFNGVDVGGGSAPVFADLDGDGDLDAVVGDLFGTLNYFENTGTALAPVFVLQTGADNPFNGADVGAYSNPVFADFDGDGDLDAVVGGQAGFGLYTGFLVYYENTGTASAPVFTERTGTANPFNGVDVGIFSIAPALADLDDDGDLDAVVGEEVGVLNYFENTTATAPSITVTVNAENDVPTAIGLPTDVTVTEDVASNLDLSAVSLADVDTTGSITVVLTASAGTITASSSSGVTVTNSGTGAITLSGAVSDIDTFLNTASAVQYTGALNANGDNAATLTITANDGSGAVQLGVVNIDITAVNDAPSATGVPTDVTVTEDVASNLNLSAITLSDIDTVGTITVTLTASAGILTASSSSPPPLQTARSDGATSISVSSVIVTNSGTGAITLTGTASAIDAYLNTASNIKYTGASNVFGDNAATVTITTNDGSGSVQLGVVNIDITGANDTPTLTGVASSVTFLENTVNAAAQLIDTDVTFADVDGSFAVGSLTVTGLLAQDTVSIRNQGTTAGLVGLSAGTLTYGGVTIGTVSGGAGGTLTISFNASATPQAVDAVIQNLTYANASDTPTASRVLTITATDGGGLAALATVTVNVTPEADITTINGTTRNDTLTGTAGADQINGRDGADTLSGGNGDDRLDGGKGADKLNGGDGADYLNGGADNDRLDGGVGNDTLLGGSGNDTLIGGAGNDTMGGGSGADIYLFNAVLFGADKITDFANGSDKIQLSGIAGVTSFANLAITAVSGGVLITLPDGSTINIAGMNVAQTDASDFIFGP